MPNSQVSYLVLLVDGDLAVNAKATALQLLVDANETADAKVTGVYLIVDALAATIVIEALDATITGTAAVTADINANKQLSGAITSNAQTVANLTVSGRPRADITASATVTAILSRKKNFTASVTCSGSVVSVITRIFQVTATVTSTSVLNSPELDQLRNASSIITFTSGTENYSNIRVGNTLNITQVLGRETTINAETDLSVAITQTAEHTDIYNRDASNKGNHPYHDWDINQTVTLARVLATKDASSDITLSQDAYAARSVGNQLILTHEASGYIYFIPCVASNDITITQLAEETQYALFTADITASGLIDADMLSLTFLNITDTLLISQSPLITKLKIPHCITLQAPYNLVSTAIVLPTPLFDDSENLVSNMTLRKSMNNTMYTYVKTSRNRLLRYTFRLSRMKALELQAFVRLHNSDYIKIENWKGEVWKARLTLNPLEFVQNSRFSPTNDGTDISLEFEGVKISG